MTNGQKTQLERTTELLVQLKPNVTRSDREEAFIQYSEFTVIQYLKGRGTNLETAINLLKLFTRKIKERENLLT